MPKEYDAKQFQSGDDVIDLRGDEGARAIKFADPEIKYQKPSRS
jgi:hypothetical protein